MASIKRRTDGRWRARYRAPDGREHAAHRPTKAEAQGWLDAQVASIVRDDYVDPKVARATRLGEYGEGWMAAQPWRPSTRSRSESVWRTHVVPAFGDRPIASIRPSQVQAWATGLRATLAPSSVEGALRLLKAVLTAATRDRVVGTSPAAHVRLPRRDGAMHVPLTVAEVRVLSDAIAPELRAAVIVAATIGLRQGELFGMTEDRVAWLRREVVIDRQLLTPARGVPALAPTKTARSVRTVPLPDHAIEALAAHRERFGTGEDGLVFHRDGEPYRRSRAALDFQRAAQASGLVASGWHALRHHAASVLIAQGLSVTAVAATLGHSPEECLRTYAGWWPNEHETVRQAMARAWDETDAADSADFSRTSVPSA